MPSSLGPVTPGWSVAPGSGWCWSNQLLEVEVETSSTWHPNAIAMSSMSVSPWFYDDPSQNMFLGRCPILVVQRRTVVLRPTVKSLARNPTDLAVWLRFFRDRTLKQTHLIPLVVIPKDNGSGKPAATVLLSWLVLGFRSLYIRWTDVDSVFYWSFQEHKGKESSPPNLSCMARLMHT